MPSFALVVELAAGDALDERLVFLAVGIGEVVAEGAGCREPGAFLLSGCGPLPWHARRQIASSPEYGDDELPWVPKNRSLTSNPPLPNCVELNATCTSSG